MHTQDTPLSPHPHPYSVPPPQPQSSIDPLPEDLAPSFFLDSDHPDIIAYAHETVGDERDPVKQSILLFRRVRDQFRYSPYAIRVEPEEMRASVILPKSKTFCVPKALVLAAAARVLGIPARLGFADVRNHLAPPGLLELMDTDLFTFHGYAELWLNGAWRKASPAFNHSLCESLRVQTLDFDGIHDAILHPFDGDGNQYMEYVHTHGSFSELPHRLMIDAWKLHYPRLFAS